jgi:hypothetical protein
MNVISARRGGHGKIKSIHNLTKQHSVILEHNGIAIRIYFDKAVNKFAVEDLKANEIKTIYPVMRKHMRQILGDKA